MRSRAAPVVLVDARSSLRRAWARALLAADPSAKLSTCEAVAGVAALVPGGVPFVLVAPARELEAAPSALLERAAVIVTADPLEIPAAAEQFAGRAQALFERLDEPPVGLAIAVAAAARALAPPAPSNDEEAGFVAVSRPMRLLTAALEAIAPARTPLFLLGEDGTGKRTLARRAHVASGHASRPS
ncbi:MAG: hypothetical protein U0271_06755 [Polyangiaceae bacterium]